MTNLILWTVVVVSLAANTVASFAGAPTAVHVACGAITVAGALALLATRRAVR